MLLSLLVYLRRDLRAYSLSLELLSLAVVEKPSRDVRDDGVLGWDVGEGDGMGGVRLGPTVIRLDVRRLGHAMPRPLHQLSAGRYRFRCPCAF